MMRGHRDQQSRMFCELSALVFNLLQSPPTPLSFSDRAPVVPVPPSESPLRRSSAPGQITPAGFASLLLGISVALMLCGSVTFFIGFMLMPWVLGLVMVFYVAGIVSSLSILGRSILCYAAPRKDLTASPTRVRRPTHRGNIEATIRSFCTNVGIPRVETFMKRLKNGIEQYHAGFVPAHAPYRTMKTTELLLIEAGKVDNELLFKLP